jgi:type II secretory pathway component PulF
MATYVWKARTRDGQINSGEIEAVNETEASMKIRTMDLIPLSLKEKPKSFFSGEISFGKPKVTMRDFKGNNERFGIIHKAILYNVIRRT